MCKAKSNGGKRCLSHLRKDVKSAHRQLKIQYKSLDFLSSREVAAGKLTLKQETERKEREKTVEELKIRVEYLDNEIEEAEERAAYRELQKIEKAERANELAIQKALENVRRQEFDDEGGFRVRLNLTEEEHAELKNLAMKSKKTVSCYVEDLLSEDIKFEALKADESFCRKSTYKTRRGPGRQPQSGYGSAIAASATVMLSGKAYNNLTANAEAFLLTLADYLRRRILKIDPRVRGTHMSERRQKAELLALQYRESRLHQNPTETELQEYYSKIVEKIQYDRKIEIKRKEVAERSFCQKTSLLPLPIEITQQRLRFDITSGFSRDELELILGLEKVLAYETVRKKFMNDGGKISGEDVERILFEALKSLGYKVEYSPGSHSIGTDMTILGWEGEELFLQPIRISVKSGTVQKNGTIKFSGCRAGDTKYPTMEDKIAHHNGDHSDIHFLMSNSGVDPNKYKFSIFPTRSLNYGTYQSWAKKDSTYIMNPTISPISSASISPSMSYQVWTHIDLSSEGFTRATTDIMTPEVQSGWDIIITEDSVLTEIGVSKHQKELSLV